jgi:hypothetical protein
VYVTDTGEKYHREGCQYLRKSSRQMTLKAALVTHTPCSACKPPTLSGSATPPAPPAAATSSDKEAPPFPKNGPAVKKVFVLKDGRTIRAVLITDNETAYVIKDVEMKFHEVVKEDILRIQDP